MRSAASSGRHPDPSRTGRCARLARWAVAGRWLLFLLLLARGPLAAQEWELDFKRYSTEDGLSHGTVWAIHQGSRGFLWIGTQDGLNRFDGYSFKVYHHDSDDPSSLAASEVLAIAEDRHGTLWIGTRGGGVNAFDRAQESFLAHRHHPDDPASLSHDTVWAILEDRDGRLWVGTEGGLDALDRRTGTFSRRLGGRRVYALCEARSGALWVATDTGLSRLAPGADSFQHYRHDPEDPRSLSDDEVFAIQEDVEGELWVATRHGLNRLDPAAATVVRYRHQAGDGASLAHDWARSLLLDRRGRLWIGTQLQGLDRFDPATGSFLHSRSQPGDPRGLASDSVLALAEDRAGNLWVGTRDGVHQHVPVDDRFVTYRHRPGRSATLSGTRIWGIHEDRDGVLWVGTVENGLNRIDRRRQEIVHFRHDPDDPRSLPGRLVSAVHEDRAGRLWVGTWNGLGRLDDRERGRFTTFRHDPADPQSLSDDRVLTLHEDAGGRLWLGTAQGFGFFEPERARFTRFPRAGDPPEIGRNAFYAIAEQPSGVLWLGSFATGLYAYDPAAHRFVAHRHDPEDPRSPAGDRIAALHVDHRGSLWIGTFGAGLDRLDPDTGRFDHFRRSDGLPDDTVLAILEDTAGDLWLSTYRGLARLDPRTRAWTSFRAGDGLQGDLFNAGSAFSSPSGELFFGGTRGLNAFFPQQLRNNTTPPVVVVTDLLLFHQPVSPRRVDPSSPLERSITETGSITLSHRSYVFSFEFAALHFVNPAKNQYQYRLEGFNKDWIQTDATKRFAQYSNLDPGRYVFRVRARNSDGIASDEDAAIEVVVKAPPWRSRPAYVIYVVSLVATLGGFLHSQKSKLERERLINAQLREIDQLKDAHLKDKIAQIEEREKLISELEEKNSELVRFNYTVSHDLKSPIVTIKNFLGMVKRDVGTGRLENLARDLDSIGEAADRMYQLLEELLEFSRVGLMPNPLTPVSLSEVVRVATALVAGQLDARGTEVRVEGDLPTVLGDRTRLVEVFQNLIDNAAKFLGDTSLPRIEIGARRDGQETVCWVRDNGVGIEPLYQEKVFGLFERLDPEIAGTGIGLALVRRIIEMHGGRVWVESKGRGHGSTFYFTLPHTAT